MLHPQPAPDGFQVRPEIFMHTIRPHHIDIHGAPSHCIHDNHLDRWICARSAFWAADSARHYPPIPLPRTPPL